MTVIVEYTDYTRYTYVSGILALVVVGTIVGKIVNFLRADGAGLRRLAILGSMGGDGARRRTSAC